MPTESWVRIKVRQRGRVGFVPLYAHMLPEVHPCRLCASLKSQAGEIETKESNEDRQGMKK